MVKYTNEQYNSIRDSHLVCFSFVFITIEGFTTVVANGGLEKARAYLNQVPWDRWLNVPFKEGEANLSPQFYFLGQS